MFAGLLTAQEYRGRIQGTVRDSSDAVIAGATVTLLNVNTGVSTVRQTNETGHYIVDLVEPGSYSITIETPGFTKFVQSNVPLASRGDVTVDATLKTGDVRETVTVAAEASQVQFTTSKLETTVDTQIAKDIPQLYRSPFVLATLDPSVLKDDSNTEYNPFNSWGPGRMSVGGGANFSNDLQVDGARVGVSVKTGYVPSPDMVQEVNVSQNTVDAEFGHGSGSAISIVTKGGTNQFHGTAYYYGRYPWASAVSDRQFRTVNLDRQQMYGGTVGNPILKNRLFNFVSFEGWKWNQAATPYNATLPTDLERTGNFSQSVNAAGGLNAIYDPWSTVTSADGSTITRTPFPGNIIPGSRQDPIAAKFMGALWKPNRPGQGYDHLNNYSVSLPVQYPYKNFADRVDFHTNKLTLTGRIQLFRTPVQTSNPTGSSVFVSNRGSERDGTTYSGTATYTLNSTTVISMSGDYHNFVDASRYPTQASEWTFAGLYPNSTFYKALYADPGIAVLQARMSISGDGGRWVDMGPGGGFWDQRPKGNGFDAKIAQQRGSHYLKAGFETLGTFAPSVLQQSNPGFGFNGDITNSTYVNPNMAVSGNPYASFLLGAVVPVGASASGWDSNETSMPSLIIPTTSTRFFGGYINDDFKINKDLTLNLGLRYEFEQPYMEDQNRLTAPLDLTKPIPELQGVQMPAGVKQFYTGSWTMNGAFQFTTSGHPGAWNAGLGTLSPRIGAAYRLNDKTSLRAGYGRYVTPWNMNSAVSDQFSAPYTGFANYTDAAPTVQGVPQMQLSNPFTSAFPIVPSYGKSYGAYTGLGGGLTYFNADRPRAYSNRFNFSVQRQLPQSIILDVTYFLNLSNRITTVNYDINQVDPRIALQYGAATNVQVANPFYHLPIPNQSPGALWNQATVSALTLARPYPQYSGALTVLDGVSGGDMIYHSLQIKGVKSFSSGYTLLVAYNYHLQTNKQFYDNVDNYLKNWTDEDSGTPRHRITASGTWALPVGKGRKFMTNAPRVLDFLIGGWNLAGTETWHSGTLLNFGGMLVSGDPTISNPGPNGWFNTSVFKQLPAYTRRTNPWYYSNIRGPKYFNIDGTISKDFHVTERIRLQLHMDAFNAINNMNYNNPNMSVTSSQFGKSTDIYSQDFGRRLQLGLRLEF
ncbi:MAG TPA: carboxypeptidase-like regulatory domain-containing protein [Bryobacteraceae bacterium]